jgi:hypothetical protein
VQHHVVSVGFDPIDICCRQIERDRPTARQRAVTNTTTGIVVASIRSSTWNPPSPGISTSMNTTSGE